MPQSSRSQDMPGGEAHQLSYQAKRQPLPVAGPLPTTWGQPGALPLLQLLVLNSNSLSQTLPPSWGSSYSQFTMLQVLLLDDNRLSGTLPANWSAGFANLT